MLRLFKQAYILIIFNIIMNKSNNYGMTQCQKCNATLSVDTQNEHWCKTHSVQQIIGYIAAAQPSNEVAA
jgi:hypothetical protein